MSISRIPDFYFVFCVDCQHYKKVLVFDIRRKPPRRVAHCVRVEPIRKLRGQKGCWNGIKKKGAE